MFDHILRRMQKKVRSRQYVMTHHAKQEMVNDGLSVFDIEHCILTGEIVNRETDDLTGEWKYCILGTTITGPATEIIAKFGTTGKLVIITVYAL